MYGFVTAIIMHENGEVPYIDGIINKGLSLAGVYNVPKPPLASEPEAKVAGGAATIATISIVSTAIQASAPAIPLLQQAITVAPWLIAVISGLGIGYLGYTLYKKHTQGV
jgi:hypothetical protein